MSNPQISHDEQEQADAWRDKHGQPDFDFLQSLMDDGSPGALEQMRNIADDLDAECDDDASFEELMQCIRAAAAKNDSGDSGIIS